MGCCEFCVTSSWHDRIQWSYDSIMLLNSNINWLPRMTFQFYVCSYYLSNRYYRAVFRWTLELENLGGTEWNGVHWLLYLSGLFYSLLVLIVTHLHINLIPASMYWSQNYFDENCRLLPSRWFWKKKYTPLTFKFSAACVF